MRNIDLYQYFLDNPTVQIEIDKFKKLKDEMGRSRIKSTQNNEELRQFLKWISHYRQFIKTYAEIGCSSGGTYYVIDSFLRSIKGSEFKGSWAMDSIDKIRDFPVYHEKYPKTTHFEHAKSHKFNFRRRWIYDLVFVDADHRYEGVLRDYEIFVGKCRFLAFHDIYFLGNEKGPNKCGVPRFWFNMKQRYGRYWEFVDFQSERGYPLGIGVLDMNTKILQEPTV